MLLTGEIYHDPGANYYDKRHNDPDRKLHRHIAELQAAGYTITRTAA
jgi:hypothetical protein